MEKIARICWNTNGWKRPSGSEGKSKTATSYEMYENFGHEEWLLDDSKVMSDGYHYAYLQPLDVVSGKHVGKEYDIHLFAISPNKQKVYVGCIHNAICIDKSESKQAFKYYKERGWIDEMKEDVRLVGGSIKKIKPDGIFNVKFKFSDAEINHSNLPIIKSDTLGHRYNLMDKKEDFVFVINDEGNVHTLDTSVIVRTAYSGEILVDPLHKKIQNAVAKVLENEYTQICLEKGDDSLESGQRIDIKGMHKATKEWHYFEVKTGSAKQSIREAMGQILEYSHYDHKSTRAAKLFIVAPDKPDEKDKAYLKKLREMYNLPIWYRWYSFEDNKLNKEI